MINLTHLVLLVQHFSWEDSSLGRLAARRVVDLEAENLSSDVSSPRKIWLFWFVPFYLYFFSRLYVSKFPRRVTSAFDKYLNSCWVSSAFDKSSVLLNSPLRVRELVGLPSAHRDLRMNKKLIDGTYFFTKHSTERWPEIIRRLPLLDSFCSLPVEQKLE